MQEPIPDFGVYREQQKLILPILRLKITRVTLYSFTDLKNALLMLTFQCCITAVQEWFLDVEDHGHKIAKFALHAGWWWWWETILEV